MRIIILSPVGSHCALSDLWQNLFETIAIRTVLRFHYLGTDAPEGRKSDDFKRQHNIADFYRVRRKWPVKFFFCSFFYSAQLIDDLRFYVYIFYLLFFTIEPPLVTPRAFIYTNIVIIIYDIIYYSGNGGSSLCRDPSRFSFYDRSVWPEAAAAAASRLRAIPLLRSSQGSRSTVVLPDTI